MDQAEPAAHPHRWGRPAQRHPGDPPQNGQDLGCSRGTIFEIFISQQSQRNRVKNLIFYRSFLIKHFTYKVKRLIFFTENAETLGIFLENNAVFKSFETFS